MPRVVCARSCDLETKTLVNRILVLASITTEQQGESGAASSSIIVLKKQSNPSLQIGNRCRVLVALHRTGRPRAIIFYLKEFKKKEGLKRGRIAFYSRCIP